MISSFAIQNLSKKLQTTELNIRREYVQHLFLAHFYHQKEAEQFFFKGDTALRIVFNSPRFSEDLDFSAKLYNTKHIEDAIVSTLNEIEREGIDTEIVESKETTGGYLTNISFRIGNDQITVLLQFSKRRSKDTSEVVTVAGDFIPPYSITLLDRKHLTNEKIQALLTRSKPRDFYDLYYLIRSNLINQEQRKLLTQVKKKLETTKINFGLELKQFLPKSHWPIIKDFKNSLSREIDRFV
ncbi:MAG: hypothetical protein US31_C0005G0032 [Berkelbacteria bacterium GW2011_GWA1_36_9]|uniref:Nucleotidyl transferase AbiEii/AbiGii toxin family protein n=1 Tax=Berkelbacteria bacterium GW2011_GWA1_36_9 TaxID=1618331 RepID=A0A0G0FKQ2_9BACT|nr:MAG: hypothetical protein US31_C0005G0032 [Berkelbacteria bacterium GW2011_GWA1_36_9]